MFRELICSFKSNQCAMKVYQQSKILHLQRASLSTVAVNRKSISRKTSSNKAVVSRETHSMGRIMHKNPFQPLNSHYCSFHTYPGSLQMNNPEVDVLESNHDQSEYTHFGYDQVKESEKVDKVHQVFESVADSYDVMNDAMSAGVHRLWKSKFVHQLNVTSEMKILDMAGGTGDIAFKILDTLVSENPNLVSSSEYKSVIISDINQAMLDVGKKRAGKLGIQKAFSWQQANAEDLPFEDESIDLYTIVFGIRNTTHIDRVLDEAFRVLKLGGRISCMEFSTVKNPIVAEIYDAYSFEVIPVLGEVLAKDYKSYKYLVESIRQFPNQEDFAEMFYEAGFSNVRFENLTNGIAAIHNAFKI